MKPNSIRPPKIDVAANEKCIGMKKPLFLLMLISAAFIAKPHRANAQAQELQQLILDIQKLSSMKSILSEMKTAYNVITTGYNSVRDITKGNFNLHEAFIDGLLLVSPNIRNYKRVADVISDEAKILSEYKSAFGSFKASNMFNPNEIDYMGKVYSNLFDESLQNIDELQLVLTDNSLSMTDDDRLQNIDRIYSDMEKKLAFLRSFNRQANHVLTNRGNLNQQSSTLKKLYGF